MKVTCIIFLLIGMIFLCMGFYKKNSYSNPESEYTYTKDYVNSYVGGDAYNYIINGTYFTAYAVIGTGFWIISSITGVAGLCLSITDDKDEDRESHCRKYKGGE